MSSSSPFVFPQTQSTVLPDPSSTYFSANLLSSPLPTNSFFQNFVLSNGSKPEYIHPYLIQTSKSSLSASYPLLFFTASVLYQTFVPDLTISSTQTLSTQQNHVISSHSDLGVTLDIPSSNLRFFLSRGSPFITASVKSSTSLSITTVHTILSLSPSNNKNTKYTLKLNNTQTWLIYTDSPISLNTLGASQVTSKPFSGIIRVAALPHDNPNNMAVLDKFSSSYPSSGNAKLEDPFHLVYQWKKEGSGDLLMLAHPLHVKLLSNNNKTDSWKLQMNHIPVTWHSNKGVEKESYQEIISVLSKDVQALSPIATASSYAYGKLIARAARLALIAEEVSFPNMIPNIKEFLKKNIEPWLDGTFPGNGFLYEKKWGGLVTKMGSTDSRADFGFGVYNDHHYHLGYFLYGIAVLAKIDNEWGNKYKPQVYALLSDFMNLDEQNSHYPRLRCFDLYRLHSWASGLTEFGDGRNQESTSEAVNAYYSAALVGLAYGDSHLVATGSTLLAMEILATQTWWLVKVEDNLYNKEFAKDNRIVGVLWSNKRDSALWWAAATCRECRLGIQVLPLSPITETLFSDAAYVKELVEWTFPSLSSQSWKGMTYALQGIYDKQTALRNIRTLTAFEDGNSFSNILWWIHSR
ncbi:hypothetical protein LR48_Vigan843s002200 [Vigna angularis]|uniref:glucan endo-1,3-beta-D-glucosidase n=1 Tax=Phaseolus angularis TaxID=3914 RepID=A0A0L9THF4_PHAAN|nr:uncharacterized protein HKW66_Vig0109380 [Vigna angularis]KOM29960.1 hypothetical protein LR48_Vigan843s002200 [Vigna angularis]